MCTQRVSGVCVCICTFLLRIKYQSVHLLVKIFKYVFHQYKSVSQILFFFNYVNDQNKTFIFTLFIVYNLYNTIFWVRTILKALQINESITIFFIFFMGRYLWINCMCSVVFMLFFLIHYLKFSNVAIYMSFVFFSRFGFHFTLLLFFLWILLLNIVNEV